MSEELIKRLEALEAEAKQIREELSRGKTVKFPFWMPKEGALYFHFMERNGE